MFIGRAAVHDNETGKGDHRHYGDREEIYRLTTPDQLMADFLADGHALRGDEWQIDVRLLKWRGITNVLGFDTAYRLERIAGRYSDIDRERASTRTVYALHPPEGVDVWSLLRSYHDYVPWADALYGSATYAPIADGAAYEVKVSQDGLIARPLNLPARQALGAWR